jgi:hypothetical protein
MLSLFLLCLQAHALGVQSVQTLKNTATSADNIVARGHAIQALAGLDAEPANGALRAIAADTDQVELVRTWAGAALVGRAQNIDEIVAIAPLTRSLPGLTTPLSARAKRIGGELNDLAGALSLASSTPEVQTALLPLIQAQGVQALTDAMFTHPDQEPRRFAAGVLAAMKDLSAQDRKQVIAAYAPNPRATQVPWNGGALYVPSMGFARDEAATLAGHLVAWYSYCDKKGLQDERQQVMNNLRSVGVWRQAGFTRPPGGVDGAEMETWLRDQRR